MEIVYFLCWLVSCVLSYEGITYLIDKKFKYKLSDRIIYICSILPVINLVLLGSFGLMYLFNKK